MPYLACNAGLWQKLHADWTRQVQYAKQKMQCLTELAHVSTYDRQFHAAFSFCAKPHVHARNQAIACNKAKDKGKAELNDNVQEE